ncbi:DUF5953 family protein [Archangium lansingense]|uniref:DUF5953 family protein n=1 Tax=Archangium lansingense TaxID=2995310 RepID=UPI00358DC4D3
MNHLAWATRLLLTSAWASAPAPRQLPVLKLPERIRSPGIPQDLGWLNYWSPAALRAYGRLGSTRHLRHFQSRLMESGARVRRPPIAGVLSDAPLSHWAAP